MLIEEFNEVEKLDEEIGRLLVTMAGIDPTDEGYAKIADQLTKLIKIKQIIAELNLKNHDASTKKTELENKLQNDVNTIDLKNREHDDNVELKRNELKVKKRELRYKEDDSDRNYLLKQREVVLKEADANKPDRVSKDALIAAGASLAGIVVIIGYERVHVIASKALSFVLKR